MDSFLAFLLWLAGYPPQEPAPQEPEPIYTMGGGIPVQPPEVKPVP